MSILDIVNIFLLTVYEPQAFKLAIQDCGDNNNINNNNFYYFDSDFRRHSPTLPPSPFSLALCQLWKLSSFSGISSPNTSAGSTTQNPQEGSVKDIQYFLAESVAADGVNFVHAIFILLF